MEILLMLQFLIW